MSKVVSKVWSDGTPFTISIDGYLMEFDVADNNGGCRFAEMTLCSGDGGKEVFDLVQIGARAVGRIEISHRTLIFKECAGIYKVILTPIDNG